jgi:hypothetical protein
MKARIKPIERWPKWTQCCPAAIQFWKEHAREIEVDLKRQEARDDLECSDCGAPRQHMRGVLDVSDNCYIPFDILDLEAD